MTDALADRRTAALVTAGILMGVATAGPLVGLGLALAALGGMILFISPTLGLVATVFANTCFQIMGSSHVIGLPTSASRAIAAATLAVWAVHVLIGRRRVVWSPQVPAIIALAIMVVIWDLVLPGPAGTMAGTARLSAALILFILVSQIAGYGLTSVNIFVYALIAAMTTSGIIGVMEHFLPALHIESDDPRLEQGAVGAVLDRESLGGVVIKRITGGVGDANWLAYSLAAAMPLLLWAWHRHADLRMRALVGLSAVLMMTGLVLSYTRTGFIGLGVAVIYLLWRRVLAWRYIVMAAVLVGAAALIYMPPGLSDRFFSQKYIKEGSTPLRTLFKARAYEIWLQSPVIGHGFAGFGQRFYERVQRRDLPNDERLSAWADDLNRSVVEGRERVENIGAHNLYLEILCEYGAVGLSVFTVFMVMVFRDLKWIEARGSPDERLLAICITAGLAGFLACGLLGHAKYLKVPWMLAGVAVAMRAQIAARSDGEQQGGRRAAHAPNPKPATV
jgi:O-antigen ligase